MNPESLQVLTGAGERLGVAATEGVGAVQGSLDERRRVMARARHDFVEAALASARVPGVCGLMAQAGTGTRLTAAEKEWICVPQLSPALREAAIGSASDAVPSDGAPARVLTADSDTWAIRITVGASSPKLPPAQLGLLCALFESTDVAVASHQRLAALASELAFGLRFLRLVSERQTFLDAASALAGGPPHERLTRIARILQDELRVDGVKVYVLRRTPDGVRLQRLLRTDTAEKPVSYALSEDRGLADWVVLNDDWLMVTEPAPKTVRGAQPERGVTGRHGSLARCARLGREAVPNEQEDPERKFLIVPLRFGGQVLGAVSVWRNTDDGFDLEADLAALEHAARLVATGCQAAIEAQVLERASEEAEKRLSGELKTANTPADVYHAYAQAVMTVAAAAGCVLFLNDGDGTAHYCAARVGLGESLALKRQTLRLSTGAFDRVAFESYLNEHTRGPDSQSVACARDVIVVNGAESASVAALVLLDGAPMEAGQRSTYDDAAIHSALRRFVSHRDVGFLGQAIEALAQRAVKELHEGEHPHSSASGEAPVPSEAPSDRLLTRAARLIRDHTGAGSVRVYTTGKAGFHCLFADPSINDPQALPAVPGPLTERTLKGKEPVHVLDLSDEADPLGRMADRERLANLARALRWPAVQSWLCLPMVIGQRCVGAFKVLTPERGLLLGSAEERVVNAIAERVMLELDDLRRADLLTALNKLATDCTALVGRGLHALAAQLTPALEDILATYITPHTRFAAFATLEVDFLSVFAASEGIRTDAILDVLENRSRDVEAVAATLPAGVLPKGSKHLYGTPLELPGTTLRGVLFVFMDDPPVRADRHAVAEAARAVSWIAEGERRWREWRREVGLFRHALLAPAQGLTSAANEVCRLATRSALTGDMITRMQRRVGREAETLRLWRENQRVYMSRDLQPRRRLQGLRDLLERCVDRYKALASARDVTLSLEWQPGGDVAFRFDHELVDVALSNLLDNAVKYCFHGRAVVVRVTTEGQWVSASVADTGHGIPDEREKAIYETGRRFAEDRVRSIDGLGLGLALAKRVAEAHDGTVGHTCDPPCPADESTDARPYLVTFVLRLPRR